VLIAYSMGYALPYPYGGETNGFWKFMILFPVIFVAVQLLLLFTVFTKDTPKYLLQKNHDEDAKEVLRKIYTGSEKMALQHYDMLVAERDLDSHAVSVTFTDLFSRKYRRRTAVGIGLVLLFQFTGVFVILTYSTPIFLGHSYTTDTANPSPAMYEKALTLTVLLGLLQFLATVPPAYMMDYIGRKSMMIWGFVGMALTYVVYEIFVTGVWAEVSVLVFIVVLNFSIGTVIWIYLPEILPDIGVGFAFLVFWVMYAFFVFGYPFFVAATSIQVAFSVFLIGNIVGIIFTAIWVKETKDKTNDQIIEMYCPKELWEHHNKESDENQGLVKAEL